MGHFSFCVGVRTFGAALAGRVSCSVLGFGREVFVKGARPMEKQKTGPTYEELLCDEWCPMTPDKVRTVRKELHDWRENREVGGYRMSTFVKLGASNGKAKDGCRVAGAVHAVGGWVWGLQVD